MEEAAWAALGFLAASAFWTIHWLGSRIDAISARIDGMISRLDAMNARLDSDPRDHA